MEPEKAEQATSTPNCQAAGHRKHLKCGRFAPLNLCQSKWNTLAAGLERESCSVLPEAHLFFYRATCVPMIPFQEMTVRAQGTATSMEWNH